MNKEKDTQTIARTILPSANNNVCPICGGCGTVIKSIVDDETRKMYGDTPIDIAVPCSRCNGGYTKRVEGVRKYSNIPSAYYDADLSKFSWTIYKDKDGKTIDLSKKKMLVDSFVDKFQIWEKRGMGLYIYSKCKGSGKTFLASCICNSLIAKYAIHTKFISVSELISLSKKTDRDEIEGLCNVRVLCLDDLGQNGSGKEWVSDLLFRILDHRMQKKLVTIITSNFSVQQLKVDDRIADRINRITTSISLPDCYIRSMEARKNENALFKELGFI